MTGSFLAENVIKTQEHEVMQNKLFQNFFPYKKCMAAEENNVRGQKKAAFKIACYYESV